MENGSDINDEEISGKRKRRPYAQNTQRKRKRIDTSDNEDSEAEIDNGEEVCDYVVELGYGEDLIKDEKDQQTLDKMSQLEREQILDERYQRREELRHMHSLKKQAQVNQFSKPTTKKDALQDYLEKKEKQKQKQSQMEKAKEEEEKKSKKSSSDYENEDSLSGESDDALSIAELDQKHSQPITLEDLERIRLSRDILEKWVDEFYFEKTVINCVIRVNISSKKSTSQVYRIFEIVNVKEQPEPYKFGKKFTKKLLITRGTREKGLKMNFVSNSKFTLAEFQEFEKTNQKVALNFLIQKEKHPLIEMETIIAKEEDIRKAKNHVYSNEEINEILLKNVDQIILKAKKGNLQDINFTYEIQKLRCQLISEKEKLVEKSKNIRSNYLIKTLGDKLKILKDFQTEKNKLGLNAIQSKSALPMKNPPRSVPRRQQNEKYDPKNKNKNLEYNPFSRRDCVPKNMWHTNVGTDGQNLPELKKEESILSIQSRDDQDHLKQEMTTEEKMKLLELQHQFKLQIDDIDSDPENMEYFPVIESPRAIVIEAPSQKLVTENDIRNSIPLSKFNLGGKIIV